MQRRPDEASAKPFLRGRLFAGAAALALLAISAPALAQTAPAQGARQTVEQPGPDGLTSDGLYLEADSITEDREAHVITATGLVQGRYQGRLLRADRVDYQTETGLLSASGNAELINPDGTLQYADTIELDDELRAGVATGFATLLQDNIRIASATAVRRSETVNELNNAIFTPCDICNSEGEPSEPTWSIQAETVVQDQENAVVFYRNAVIRVAGVPVFYSPVFWHPDPTAERQSGFLIPTITTSDGRGFSYEQPYLWVISPHQDLIISPQVNASVNPFLNLDWRRRFYSGQANIRAGYTHERLFGNIDTLPGPGADFENERYGEAESRGYVLGEGEFNINRDWRWGFSVERVSDKSLFDRYDIEDVYEDRGLYLTDYRRLISQAYVVRQTQRSFFSLAVLSFQSLRPIGFGGFGFSTRDARGVVYEDDGTLPLVGPMIEARWEPEDPVLGGRLRFRGSAVALFRQDYVGSPVLSPLYAAAPPPADMSGVDSTRATVEIDWRRSITTSGGLRFEPFLTGRADVYSVSDLPAVGSPSENDALSRFNATLGVDVRYPLIRRFEGGSVTLEPMAQLAVSPDADIDPRIPNEDSQVLELDETSLFQENKFPGYDLYEGGARLSLGVRTTVEMGPTRRGSLFVGRMFRAEDEPDYLRPIAGSPGQLYDPTGISETSSDWVVAATLQPFANASGWARARLDDDLSVRTAEVGFGARFRENDRVSLRYIVDNTDPSPLGSRNYETVQVSGQVFLVGDWGVSFRAMRDLDENLWRRSEVGLLYEDECLRFELLYERDETVFGQTGLRSSEGVFVRLNLATLGGSGY
ncbi:LPS-assembly protein LptD [Brevundimonas sp.]|uniref:LPS-assembly protein LptD n=1 Tax=Brevundimonas sp. TaxID=1871086 RepID=UPI0025EFBE6A|nr:LPS-assembly protein LptD [Brevundimonas sp.]